MAWQTRISAHPFWPLWCAKLTIFCLLWSSSLSCDSAKWIKTSGKCWSVRLFKRSHDHVMWITCKAQKPEMSWFLFFMRDGSGGWCICFLPVQSRIKEQRLQPLRTRWIDVSLLFDGDTSIRNVGLIVPTEGNGPRQSSHYTFHLDTEKGRVCCPTVWQIACYTELSAKKRVVYGMCLTRCFCMCRITPLARIQYLMS